MSVWTLSIGGVVGLTVLMFVLTGPGFWSEKWGWRLMNAEWSWRTLKQLMRGKRRSG